MDRRATRKRRLFRRWFRLFVALLVLATVGVSAAVSGLLVYLGTLPPIERLEHYAPPQVTRVLDRHREEMARFKRENRVMATLDEIPDILIQAFLATEDENFYKHFGIDFRAVVRAVLANVRARRFAQGFSTISLQLPRNIQETTPEKKLKRKLRDIVLALQIERRYSKDQILEFYLNQIYLGSGAYGVKAAARTYFNKGDPLDLAGKDTGQERALSGDLSSLTLAECALLAGLPRAPSLYSPIRNPELAKRRRDWVLRRMLEAGHIDREVCEKTRLEPVRLDPPSEERNRAPYFVEYLKGWLARNTPFSVEALFADGYVIHSTLDEGIQRICDEELRRGLREAELKWQERKNEQQAGDAPRSGQMQLAEITAVASGSITVRLGGHRAQVALPERLPYYQPEKIVVVGNLIEVEVSRVSPAGATFEATLFDRTPIQGAAVVLGARTGEILAMSGGFDFYDEAANGQWNRAAQAARQVGSCFKPLVYALGLESGLTTASMFNDRPVRFPNGYSPKNYEQVYFGPTPLQVALEHSRNVVTVLLYQHLLDTLGGRAVAQRLRQFDCVEDGSAWDIAPSDVTISLGSLSVTPLELAAAYVPFVNRGVAIEPSCVRKVDYLSGTVESFRPKERVLLKPETAAQMVTMMRSVVLNGTGRPISRYFDEVRAKDPDRLIPQMAGKTGTTNDCTDAWFAGFTPELVAVVYMGFDTPRSLGPAMTGSHVAAPTWCRIMDRVLRTQSTWQPAFL